jgi:hypothetical protein
MVSETVDCSELLVLPMNKFVKTDLHLTSCILREICRCRTTKVWNLYNIMHSDMSLRIGIIFQSKDGVHQNKTHTHTEF